MSDSIKKYVLILLALYPIAAVSSQTVLDTVMILIAIFWLYVGYKNGFKKAAKIRLIGIEWAFVAYLIVIVLGFVINAAKDAPMAASLAKFSWIINLYILIYAFENVDFDFVKTIKFLSVGLLIPTLYALAAYLNGTDFINGRDTTRLTGLLNSATYHAHGNAVPFVFLIVLLAFNFKKIPPKWLYFSIWTLVLLILSILLTFTRGIWLSILASLVIMSLLTSFKRTMFWLSPLVLLVGILYFTWPKFHERASNIASSQQNIERINLFKVNMQMWHEYPWLGIGYGENLRRNKEYWDRPEWSFIPKDYITSHAHNQYVNVLSTTGILGEIAFMSFFGYFLLINVQLLRKCSTNKKSKEYLIAFACLTAQIEFWLACLTDVGFEYAKIRALLLLVWALVVATQRKVADQNYVAEPT